MSRITPADGILNLLVRIWRLLRRHRKLQFGLALGLMVVSAFAEIVSLGAVLPFLGVLISPEKVFNHTLAASSIKVLGITSADQLALPLTIIFLSAALIAGGIRILLLWFNARLTYAIGTDLSVDIYQRTLYQPYSVHIARNSSEVISAVTGKVSITVSVIGSLLTLIGSAVLLVAVMWTLVAIDPKVALIVFGGFGFSYAAIAWFVRSRLQYNGQKIAREHIQVVKALQEGLGGIRDVLLDGTQEVYCKIYGQAEYTLNRAKASNSFIAGSPRYTMEPLGITLIAVLAYTLSGQTGGLAEALPTLGALALGMQRLLPALQQAYGAWSNIVGSQAALADTIELLDQPMQAEALQTDLVPFRFQESIRFDNVCFRYNPDAPWVLDSFSLTIPKGVRMGFVGSTGSGKSTALDLLMGLLAPTEGELLVDGQPIGEKRIRAWQETIAHVPQSIYLADSTIAENIAFGVPLESIDHERVKQAANKAQIADFIESKPEGYGAIVGEGGIRLSGGQRQRIGIARALYKQATIIIFDEATSALDNATEQSVMSSIEMLNHDLTILIIAHRLTTIQRCDTIVELKHGRIVTQGTYDQLCASSSTFQKMSNAEES
jgi:ATP-binding cassette, subfamily B, bacterial PglK